MNCIYFTDPETGRFDCCDIRVRTYISDTLGQFLGRIDAWLRSISNSEMLHSTDNRDYAPRLKPSMSHPPWFLIFLDFWIQSLPRALRRGHHLITLTKYNTLNTIRPKIGNRIHTGDCSLYSALFLLTFSGHVTYFALRYDWLIPSWPEGWNS